MPDVPRLEAIDWEPRSVALGDLKPWDINPRRSTKKQQAAIQKSFADFGQVQTVAIGPDGSVLDGHQRLTALLAAHGPRYKIDVRQASRPLTEDERKKLVVLLHAGAAGSWDWDALSGWDAESLQEWGMNADLLKDLGNDASNLAEMIASEKAPPKMEEIESGIENHVTIRIVIGKGDVVAFSEKIRPILTEYGASQYNDF